MVLDMWEGAERGQWCQGNVVEISLISNGLFVLYTSRFSLLAARGIIEGAQNRSCVLHSC